MIAATLTENPTATEALAALEADEQYATVLWRLVREAIEHEPTRYANVARWEHLGDVCDENEFIIEADEELGDEMPDPTTDEAGWIAYCESRSLACDIVTAMLIVCLRADADARLGWSPRSGTVPR